jgi:hypothetical protein
MNLAHDCPRCRQRVYYADLMGGMTVANADGSGIHRCPVLPKPRRMFWWTLLSMGVGAMLMLTLVFIVLAVRALP